MAPPCEQRERIGRAGPGGHRGRFYLSELPSPPRRFAETSCPGRAPPPEAGRGATRAGAPHDPSAPRPLAAGHTDHRVVVQRAAAVLSSLDDRRDVVLGDGHPRCAALSHRPARRYCDLASTLTSSFALEPRGQGRPARAAASPRPEMARVRPASSLPTSSSRPSITAWGYRRVPPEHAAVGLLTLRRAGQRRRILPPELIPVGDVHPERNDLRAGDGLSVFELAQHRIGRRTARTAFRSEKLDDHRDTIAAGRLGHGRGQERPPPESRVAQVSSRYASWMAEASASRLPRLPASPASGCSSSVLYPARLVASTSIVILTSSLTTGAASTIRCTAETEVAAVDRHRRRRAGLRSIAPCFNGADGPSTSSDTSLVTP